MKKNDNKNKKKIMLLALALLITGIAVRGTVAWLTRTSELKNSFVIGTINEPTTHPDTGLELTDFSGYIIEPSWDDTVDHKIIPGIEFDKDPQVGIGKGSEDAVVYVYIENNFSNKVYFQLNDAEWTAVEHETESGSLDGTYTSGLFKYSEVLTGSDDEDSWTPAIFEKIMVDDTASTTDLTADENAITIKTFIHQAKDGQGQEINQDTILEAAKTSFGITQ